MTLLEILEERKRKQAEADGTLIRQHDSNAELLAIPNEVLFPTEWDKLWNYNAPF